MDRRELLKMIALLTGGVVVGGEVFLTGCKSGGKADVGFTPSNIALLDEVGETILPATSSPGAKAAQIGEFMKVMVTDCYAEKEQEAFKNGINELEEACKKMHKKGFMECTAQERHDFLISLEKESKEFNKTRDERDKPQQDQAEKEKREFVRSPSHYYSMMKQLTLLGFFTSKPGATQALRHVAVPGRYDGALPYKKGDKAWAE